MKCPRKEWIWWRNSHENFLLRVLMSVHESSTMQCSVFINSLGHFLARSLVISFNCTVCSWLVLMARRDWRSGGPRFKSYQRLISQSRSNYQLDQLGSEGTPDPTFEQLTILAWRGIKYWVLFKMHLFDTKWLGKLRFIFFEKLGKWNKCTKWSNCTYLTFTQIFSNNIYFALNETTLRRKDTWTK